MSIFEGFSVFSVERYPSAVIIFYMFFKNNLTRYKRFVIFPASVVSLSLNERKKAV